jgi:tetratricopeptide (TPR) repeat protein
MQKTGYALILALWGPLSLRDERGRDVTPRARKAQGILALLGTSPNLRRSRAWLQDKLWSDRGQEQGAASLRQCLTELRLVLGPHVDCLKTDGGWVALDPAMVQVISEPPGHLVGEETEFLEGLDIRDPEFENWIRNQRSTRTEPAAIPTAAAAAPVQPEAEAVGKLGWDRPFLVVAPAEAPRDDLKLLGNILAENVALQIADEGNAQLVEMLPQVRGLQPMGLRLLLRAAELGSSIYFQFRLTDLASGTVIWIGLKDLDQSALSQRPEDLFGPTINQAVSTGVNELGRMSERSSDEDRLALLGYQASRHTVLLDLADQNAADRMLAQAYDLHPQGIYLARRALLRHNQFVERTVPSPEAVRSEAIEFARRALAADPNNATVVAAAAKILLNLDGKAEGGLELALRATRIGPTNPLAWESLAVARGHLGQWDEAYAAALRARDFASTLPQSYYWDVMCCMIATGAGRYADAIRFGERARDLAPTFKPPLRYLAALYYHAGRIDDTLTQLRALSALEPDFSVETLADPDYPTAGLRRTPLISIAKTGLR